MNASRVCDRPSDAGDSQMSDALTPGNQFTKSPRKLSACLLRSCELRLSVSQLAAAP
ncbi:hypothetical protein C2845_PM03G26220 [Panicum miliaceum]|uniref:Uncharacterized protein n=1 Tax=Panicum miliaceum TaxID=4540 RepID=A0A3L6T811_PANMI|nr:hypothetical protein C2845_PM03G26220 [Panicum miliaceum]